RRSSSRCPAPRSPKADGRVRSPSVSCLPASEGLAHPLAVLRGHHASCRPSDMKNRPAWLDRSVASPPLRCAHRPVPLALRGGRYTVMVIVGIDAHKRPRTAVGIVVGGRKLGAKATSAATTGATPQPPPRAADR